MVVFADVHFPWCDKCIWFQEAFAEVAQSTPRSFPTLPVRTGVLSRFVQRPPGCAPEAQRLIGCTSHTGTWLIARWYSRAWTGARIGSQRSSTTPLARFATQARPLAQCFWAHRLRGHISPAPDQLTGH